MLTECGGSDADIGYCPDTADALKGRETGKKPETCEPAITISQDIVQDKVAGHCGDRPARLCNRER